MQVSPLQVILLLVGGIFLSIATGLFKDWLKKIIPKQVAIIGFILFISGAIITGIINYKKDANKITSEISSKDDKTETQKNKVLYNEYLEKGKAFYFKGVFDSSVYWFNESIRVVEYNNESYYWLGLTYQKKVNYTMALYNFGEAITGKNDIDSYYYARAECYTEMKDYSKALADYSKAIILNPKSDSYLKRGYIYQNLNNLEHALSDYDKSISLDSTNSLAHLFRGSIIFITKPKTKNAQILTGIDSTALRAIDMAISEYSKAIIYNPNLNVVYEFRAEALIERMRTIQIGDFLYQKCQDEIEECYKYARIDIYKMFKLNQNKSKAYFYRAYTLLLKAGSDKSDTTIIKIKKPSSVYKEAIVDLDSSIAIDKSYPKAFYLRSLINSYKGDHISSRKDSLISINNGYSETVNDKVDKLLMLHPAFN